MAAADEIAVFVDTSLGTRLAMSVPPQSTVGDLKRKIKPQHYTCFPTIGEIKVQSLMVKKKSTFYQLPDSMPVRVFQSFHATCFFHMVISPFGITYNEERSKKMKISKDIAGETVQDEQGTIDMQHTTKFIADVDSEKEENVMYQSMMEESPRLDQKAKVHKSQCKSGKRHNQISLPLESIPSGSFSKEISVTSLITKYFSDSGEINSSSSLHNREMDAEKETPQYNNVINSVLVGCQASISDFSAKHGSSSRLNLDFNISVSRNFENEKSFSNARCHNIIPPQRQESTRDVETFSLERSSFSQSKNKASRSKCIKYGRSVDKTPHCYSKLSSSNSYFSLDASTIRAAKYELGKRVSSAANRIWSPDRANRSSKSAFVKLLNHSTCKLASLVERFSFESCGSDD